MSRSRAETLEGARAPSDFDVPLPQRIWWPWDEEAASVGFERQFEVRQAGSASLYLTASGPLVVWLDGERLAMPALELPIWRTVVELPLALTAGPHRLSIEAQPGDHGQPYLLGCLDWVEAGRRQRFATDASWRMVREPKEAWGVRCPEGAWRSAWAFDGVWAEPWGLPCNAPDDFLRLSADRQVVLDEALKRVVLRYSGLAGADGVTIAENGAIYLRPVPPFARRPPELPAVRPRLEWYRTREAHSLINNSRLDLFEGRVPHVVLDAGVETFGRLRVRLAGGGPAVLAITTGESVHEVARYDRRVTDIVTLRDGETFTTSPTGFRFVKLLALGGGDGGSVEVDPVVVQHVRYPVERRGHFECDDAMLNAVWEASVRTVHLCMQNEIWDGIKRDQLPWMGDLYVEALAAYHAFGDGCLARRTFGVLGELGAGESRPLVSQRYPGLQAIWRAPSGYINDIPTYTLWWLVGLADYVRYTGDETLLEELAPELEATMVHLASSVGRDGIWRARDGWDFVDWSPLTEEARAQFTHLLACQAMGLGAELWTRIGGDDSRYRALQLTMVAAARHAWWGAGGGRMLSSHHGPAMAIRAGLLTAAEARALFGDTLAHDEPLRMTYWYRYADLDAALEVSEVSWGLAYIRRHWGAAVEAGHATLWETLDAEWLAHPDPHALTIVGSEYARYGGYETSLCHGWSAGPVPWLHRAVLGVRPDADGFSALRFAPDLGDLAWASGVVPTPRGDIHVALARSADGAVATLRVPFGVDVHLPESVRASWRVEIETI